MTAGSRQQMEQLLLTLLPWDGAAIGNGKLYELMREAAKSAGARWSRQACLSKAVGGAVRKRSDRTATDWPLLRR